MGSLSCWSLVTPTKYFTLQGKGPMTTFWLLGENRKVDNGASVKNVAVATTLNDVTVVEQQVGLSTK